MTTETEVMLWAWLIGLILSWIIIGLYWCLDEKERMEIPTWGCWDDRWIHKMTVKQLICFAILSLIPVVNFIFTFTLAIWIAVSIDDDSSRFRYAGWFCGKFSGLLKHKNKIDEFLNKRI